MDINQQTVVIIAKQQKDMKKIILYSICIWGLLGVISCSEKSTKEKIKDCLEEKYKSHKGFFGSGDDIPKNIDDCISDNKFDIAKDYADCYQQGSEIEFKKVKEDIASAEVDFYLKQDDYATAREKAKYASFSDELKNRINKAEILFYLKNNSEQKALLVATENNAKNVYQELKSLDFPNLIQRKQYPVVYKILKDWSFSEQCVLEKQCLRKELDGINKKYNEEVDAYNKYVDNLLEAAKSDADEQLIFDCMQLYRDNLEVASTSVVKKGKKTTNDMLNVKSKKINPSKSNAQKKLNK